jgi:hypothetical protein
MEALTRYKQSNGNQHIIPSTSTGFSFDFYGPNGLITVKKCVRRTKLGIKHEWTRVWWCIERKKTLRIHYNVLGVSYSSRIQRDAWPVLPTPSQTFRPHHPDLQNIFGPFLSNLKKIRPSSFVFGHKNFCMTLRSSATVISALWQYCTWQHSGHQLSLDMRA